MIGRDSKADMDAYGLWPWAAGVLLAALLIGVMFALAKGFA
ncbi:MAG: hypothetical protein RLN99_09780 [Kiloniellaceae bacterium]